MEHPKTVTKLSKHIKQPRNITFYAQSKESDPMLQSDIIKRHILPMKCSCHEKF